MGIKKPSRRGGSNASGRVPRVLVPIHMTPDQRKRFRHAAVDADMTYAELIIHLLDERDRRLFKRQREQVHPLHVPVEETA